ncbi:MAG: type II toxin-antitoxin system HicB family antitoxin [Synergistaceae bacterium]|nr:type II toxin-antitoxin system HicB family antitoxin [Synergistaceae bacterium]
MTHEYNLSLIFYPQRKGGYTVICPELHGCISEGNTIDEATENIRNVIAGFLPDEIKSAADEETLRLGLCMEGKLYQELKVTADDAGEVCFPSAKRANVA